MWLLCVMTVGSIIAPPAHASFMGYYDFNGTNWTVASTSDGFAFSSADSTTAYVFGGNDGSGLPGTTTALVTAPAAGTVQFDYLFNNLDQASPGYIPDAAGWVLNGAYTQVATNDGDSGTITFSVNSGDSFGFEVWTADNTGEPGILTVSNFTAPDGGVGSDVPEPRTLPMSLLAAAIAAAYLRFKRSYQSEENA